MLIFAAIFLLFHLFQLFCRKNIDQRLKCEASKHCSKYAMSLYFKMWYCHLPVYRKFPWETFKPFFSDFAEEIVRTLEDRQNEHRRTFKCCVHERDWIPGNSINSNILDSVNLSRRTLILLSPHFLQSNYCKQEFR